MAATLDADGYTIAVPPAADLCLTVTIPAYNEPDLKPVLKSLADCTTPDAGSVEIIVVVNQSQVASDLITAQNRTTIADVRQFAADCGTHDIAFHVVAALDLPRRHAGVGTARKIGMDLAAQRLARVGADGVIACLDADCTVADNYFLALLDAFAEPELAAASIYFEHPLGQLEDPEHRRAATYYELYLRYYNTALRRSGHPGGFHTVGSSLSVRASAYQKQGGMNRRRGAEDFYFVQKLLTLGSYSDIVTTTVYPAARVSDRVPFGTGRAVSDWMLRGRTRRTAEHPLVFADLAWLFTRVPHLYEAPAEVFDDMPQHAPALFAYFETIAARDAIARVQRGVRSYSTFVGRFWSWMNLFRCLKFAHFARDRFYPETRIEAAVSELLADLQPPADAAAQLAFLRAYERASAAHLRGWAVQYDGPEQEFAPLRP